MLVWCCHGDFGAVLVCAVAMVILLQCLCVVMKLLSLVSSGAGHSLMDASSLAIVMAPNLIKTSKTVFDIHDHCLRVQRSE